MFLFHSVQILLQKDAVKRVSEDRQELYMIPKILVDQSEMKILGPSYLRTTLK